MMQPYFCACLCAVILNATLLTEKSCKRMGVRPFDVLFPAVCTMALSLFEIKPFPELRFDPAVVLLPVGLLLVAMNQQKKGGWGRKLFMSMLIAALLPIAGVSFGALTSFLENGYAFIDLTSSALAMWQVSLCAVVFFLMSGISLKKTAL